MGATQAIETRAPVMGTLFNSLPLQERTIIRLIERANANHGPGMFLETVGGELRFDELSDIAGRVAAGLAAHGVHKGDRVALLASNRIEWAMAYFGCAWVGAVLVPLAPNLRGHLLTARLEHCQPTVVIGEADAMRDLLSNSGGLTELRASVVLSGSGGPSPTCVGDFLTWTELVAAEPAPAADLAFDDVFMIAYTSGTTGPSKGVVVTHHQVYCSSVPLTENLSLGPEDILWTCLPLNHVGAQYHVFLPALISGAHAIIRGGFSASDFWRDVRDSGATYAQVIGMMANVMLDAPPHSEDKAHSLRIMSSFPPPNDPASFAQRFGVQLNTQIWGMTEVYPNPPRQNPPPKAISCVGRPSDLFDVRIVDEEGRDVPKDAETSGEVIVRPRLPASMIREYYLNPEGTTERIRDGWFYTGDLMSWDDEGFFYFVGRSKDMIRRRGENVSAFELEVEAERILGVEGAAAYGMPSDLGDEDIKIDIVLAPGTTLTEQQIVETLKKSLPFFMVPRYVQLRKSFPTTPAGKIEKYKLSAEGLDHAVDVLGPGGKAAR